MKMEKCCKDFEDAEKTIHSALVLASTHGYPTFKKSFIYCPYCKKEIKK